MYMSFDELVTALERSSFSEPYKSETLAALERNRKQLIPVYEGATPQQALFFAWFTVVAPLVYGMPLERRSFQQAYVYPESFLAKSSNPYETPIADPFLKKPVASSEGMQREWESLTRAKKKILDMVVGVSLYFVTQYSSNQAVEGKI